MSPTPDLQVLSLPATRRGRQRVANACDECRRRKLRCDAQQPQCRVCQADGLTCETTQRGVRGPKKGYIEALKGRVVQLEALLESRANGQPQEAEGEALEQHAAPNFDSATNDIDLALPTPPVDIAGSTAVTDYAPPWMVSGPELLLSNSSLPTLDSLSEWPLPSVSPSIGNSLLQISNAMHAELDQLYMERVHPSIPILHQRRYFSWTKSNAKTPTQKCLQHAMWTLAALLSAQFRDLIDLLYQETKQMLQSLGIEGNGVRDCDTELVQAWLLITTCESMRTFHRQAWMSAGQAFRLVQVMRFHEIDSPKGNGAAPLLETSDFEEIEERRRAFWLAYLLDHLFSMRNDWPITLNEHMICTRLPAPEAEFQNGQRVLGDFLSEVMADPDGTVQSPFTECLILATICGRSLFRGQRDKVFIAYGDHGSNAKVQRRLLDSLLEKRLQVLTQLNPLPTATSDPLLLFAHVLGQAAVIYYCRGLSEITACIGDSVRMDIEVLECRNRALLATETILGHTKALADLHFSKIHPYMPLLMFLTAEFLYDNRNVSESFGHQLLELVEALRELRNVNNYDQNYLDLLPRSCISKSAELLNHSTKENNTEQR